MAARKLQTEIDRTLKKVSEGVEQFDDQYKKIQQTTNFAHKEKLESELKTQIKKLQRLRDQIKAWLASNEIKDKKVLTDYRKLIETQMERFKACEKEMKTKAFSKEGLSAGAKLDPKEQLKLETAAFVSNMVDELGRQVEATEAEVEQLQGGAKKGKKGSGSADRIAELEHTNDRRNWHVGRLELINRLMENGNLDPDKIVGLKEDITYFVESNTEEDFEEDEGIYDDLNLDEEEEAFGMGERDDLQSSHDSMSAADTSEIYPSHAPPPSVARTPARTNSSKSSQLPTTSSADDGGDKSPTSIKTKARKPTLDSTTARPTGLNPPSRSVSGNVPSATPSIISSTTPAAAPAPRSVPVQLPPIRYSAAAASAVNNPSAMSVTSPPATTTTTSIASLSAADQTVASPISTTAPATNASGLTAAGSTAKPPSATTQAQPTTTNNATSPEVQKASLPVASASASEVSPSPAVSYASVPAPSQVSGSASASPGPSVSESAQQASPSPAPSSIQPTVSTAQALELAAQSSNDANTDLQAASLAAMARSKSPLPPQQRELASSSTANNNGSSANASPAQQQSQLPSSQAPGAQAGQAQTASSGATGPSGEPRLPSSLADLVTSFESAKQKSVRGNDLGAVQDILAAGYPNIPQPADAEKPRYYIPRNTFPTPHYYPQQPSPHLANANLFAKFDTDTLFYIFYYSQGTYLQYLAAQELKKQSWRFHKQYLTWFQRANEPQVITDEYEQGVYLYFDFEGSWAQRRKENFSFYYRHLEE